MRPDEFTPEWSAAYLAALNYTGGAGDARKVAYRLREIAGDRPVTTQDCYVVVPRAELQLLAQVIDQTREMDEATLRVVDAVRTFRSALKHLTPTPLERPFFAAVDAYDVAITSTTDGAP